MKRHLGKIFFCEDNFQTEFGATLTIDGDKFELEFIDNTYRTSNYKIIQGEFLDLGYVTLIDCTHSGRTMGVLYVTKYSIQHIITEIKFKAPEDLIAPSLHIKMPVLKDWIRETNLKGNLCFDKKIEYSTPEKVLFYENERFTIYINFHINEKRNIYKGININEYCVLEIKSKIGSENIFDLLNIYKKIKIFLSFLGFFNTTPDELDFVEDKKIYDNQDHIIYMKFLTTNFNTSSKGLISHDRITYKDIQNDLIKVFNNWLSNDKIQDSIVLIMEKYTIIKLTVETYFLNTCFAIETFHRKNKNNEIYKKKDFDKIKRGIRSKLETKEEIDLFNDKLIYANEPTFKNRLISLKFEFESISHEGIDIEAYIDKIVNTRNYLVHRGKKSNIFNGLDLYYAALNLETLTKYCIMETIGFDNKLLKKIFENTGSNIKQFYEFNVSNKLI